MTEPDEIERLRIRRHDRLGGTIREYQHARLTCTDVIGGYRLAPRAAPLSRRTTAVGHVRHNRGTAMPGMFSNEQHLRTFSAVPGDARSLIGCGVQLDTVRFLGVFLDQCLHVLLQAGGDQPLAVAPYVLGMDRGLVTDTCIPARCRRRPSSTHRLHSLGRTSPSRQADCFKLAIRSRVCSIDTSRWMTFPCLA
ncbi:hypothetical protein [Yinghuangia aomiensis]|uniref:hypothetical protein n=1 Tax=Yinghuangia aomiensis TaxID=676205 RepID=UPI0031E84D40